MHAAHDAVCDTVEPWEHGTVVRASRYPTYFDYNLVRVEDRAELSVDALVAFADEALAGLTHRRVRWPRPASRFGLGSSRSVGRRRLSSGCSKPPAALLPGIPPCESSPRRTTRCTSYARLGFRPVWTDLDFLQSAVAVGACHHAGRVV